MMRLPMPADVAPFTEVERIELTQKSFDAIRTHSRAHDGRAPRATDVAWWAMQVGTYEITVRELEARLVALGARV